MADDVLVVEDDPEINELVGAYAQLAGFEYRRALTGSDALSEIGRRAPALIVLDVMLPDLDGFEVCRQLKQNGSAPGARVPVIFLTAMDNDAARRKGMECGAVEYLIKPFDPDRLMESLERHGHPTPSRRTP
jgi:two-component system, OmpR family, phosphate regulon response regulator OmpR